MTRLIDADALALEASLKIMLEVRTMTIPVDISKMPQLQAKIQDCIVDLLKMTIPNVECLEADAIQRAGWVSAPIEPDIKMIIRAIRTKNNMDNYSWIEIFTECYKAMIQAAQTDKE